jgi:hypothetical protein
VGDVGLEEIGHRASDLGPQAPRLSLRDHLHADYIRKVSFDALGLRAEVRRLHLAFPNERVEDSLRIEIQPAIEGDGARIGFCHR